MAQRPWLAVAAARAPLRRQRALAGALRSAGPGPAAAPLPVAAHLRLPRGAGAAAHALRPVARELGRARWAAAEHGALGRAAAAPERALARGRFRHRCDGGAHARRSEER